MSLGNATQWWSRIVGFASHPIAWQHHGDMAVPAPPGPSDARVPCPLCGGLIHPVAGKCKHCKADLTIYHAARPAANAPLPALHPTAGTNGHANGRANAHAAHAPARAVPTPVAPTYDASQPVLPPRPTGQSYPAEPKASRLRSWPVLVIILATVAIVVAVVLMVWPSGRRDLDGKHTIAPPPAPERMQTAPEMKPPQMPNPKVLPAPPPAGTPQAPWTGQIDPPPPDPNGSPLATDLDDDDDPGFKDPFASPHGSQPGHPQRNGHDAMMLALMKHVCQKVLQCSAADPRATTTCNALVHRPSPPPANCPAADRCLRRIDAIGCGNQADNLAQLSTLILQPGDCAEAFRC